MSDDVRRTLVQQFEIAWALTRYHLDTLTTEECLWRPAVKGLHVHQADDGEWRAEWPDHEGYDLGPPSIAWLTWHIIFWWSSVLDSSFSSGSLRSEAVPWPGTADAVRDVLQQLNARWTELLASLTDEDLRSAARTRWPFQDRPFADVVAWANVELTKNAAEIGYARFLYGVRGR